MSLVQLVQSGLAPERCSSVTGFSPESGQIFFGVNACFTGVSVCMYVCVATSSCVHHVQVDALLYKYGHAYTGSPWHSSPQYSLH